jgi:hypothetical protein
MDAVTFIKQRNRLRKEYRDMNCDLRDCAECRKEFWMKEVE